MMNSKRKNVFFVFIFVVVLFGILFFLSMASSFYLFDRDEDTNVYMIVSKQMQSGKVIYRDIFDHKGPLWYFAFNFLYSIFDSPCFLYFMQVLFGTLFFIYSYKTFNLLADSDSCLNYVLMCIFCCTVYISPVIESGGRPDEYALPLASYSIFLITKYLKQNCCIRPYQFFIVGLHIGVLFWTKFTLLWFYFCLFVFIIVAKHPHLVRNTFLSIFGIFVVTLPLFLYFWTNDALSDLFGIYIYDNLFGYGDLSTDWFMMVYYNIGEILYSYGVFWVVLDIMFVFVCVFCSMHRDTFSYIRPYLMLCLFISSIFFVFGLFRFSYMYYYTQFFAVLPLFVHMFVYCVGSGAICSDKFSIFFHAFKKVFLSSILIFGMVVCQVCLFEKKLGVFDTPNIFEKNAHDRIVYKVTDYIKEHPLNSVRCIGSDVGYNQLLDYKYYPTDEFYVANVNLRINEIRSNIRGNVLQHKYDYIILTERRPDFWENNKLFLEMNGYSLVLSGSDHGTNVALFCCSTSG